VADRGALLGFEACGDWFVTRLGDCGLGSFVEPLRQSLCSRFAANIAKRRDKHGAKRDGEGGTGLHGSAF